MQHPQIVVNWGGMAAAMVAAFFFGFLWYGPLFGKTWAGLMGMDFSKKPEPKVMQKALAIQVVGLFLTVYVLSYAIPVWRATVWNAGPDMANWQYGLCVGVLTWAGFYVPLQLNKVAWESRPWKLFFINAAHDFLNLQIMAQIISHVR